MPKSAVRFAPEARSAGKRPRASECRGPLGPEARTCEAPDPNHAAWKHRSARYVAAERTLAPEHNPNRGNKGSKRR
eukprot:11235354-Alexandrium_andersonii.AAC.1